MRRIGHLWRGAIVRFMQRGYEGVREGTVVAAHGVGVLLEVDGERVRLPRTAVTKIVSPPRPRRSHRRRNYDRRSL
jgi:hypothetical protein